MKRLIAKAMEGRVRRTIVGLGLLFGLSLLTLAIPRPSGADVISVNTVAAVTNAAATSTLSAKPGEDWADPARTMGAKSCIRCHRSEYLGWLTTKHYQSGKKIAEFAGNTEKYAKELGITQETLGASVCASCHVTPQTDGQGKIEVISGVSCESCHGGSGGQDGWLNRHAVYGPNVTRFANETQEHRDERIQFCEEKGMVRAANEYAIAKNCVQCHIVSNEKLVNAGHPAGSEGFEVVGWSIGESRHNFHEDQSVNAKGPSLWQAVVKLETGTAGDIAARKRIKFIVGNLVNLETSLAAIANAKEGDSDYVGANIERAALAGEILGGTLDALEDDAPDELGEAMEAYEGAEIEDADFTEEDARKSAGEAAKSIGEIARKIAAMNGTSLAGIDEFMNDEVVSVKGEPYSRKP